MERHPPSLVRLEDPAGHIAHLDLVRAVALAANTSWDPADAFNVAVQAVCDHTAWPVGIAWLVEDDDEQDWLVPHAVHTGNDERFAPLVGALAPQSVHGGGVMTALVATASGGAAWRLAGSDAPLAAEARACGLDASVAFCVIVDGAVHGILQFLLPPQVRPEQGLFAAMETVSTQLARVVERTATEAALEVTRAQLQALLEHTTDAVLHIGPDGTIVAANPRAAAVLGRDRADLVGRLAWSDVPDEIAATATLWPSAAGGFGAVLQSLADTPVPADLDRIAGVQTREAFLRRVSRALARRDTGPVAVAVVDLEQFSRVNDAIGPAGGDQTLQAVAQRLVLATGDAARVGRVGNDEFAVLLAPGDRDRTTLTDAGTALLAWLTEPFSVGGHRLLLRARVGVAADTALQDADARVGDPSGEQPATTLLHAADAARRARGPRRVTVFEPSLRRQRATHLTLETALGAALSNGGVGIHYQPVIELETGRLSCVEALARWNDGEHGQVPPERFIGIAEETGLIHELGRQVLRSACEQAARWRAERPQAASFGLAVNLSAAQLDDDELVGVVETALEGAGLPAEALILEVTESLLSQDDPAARHRLWDLRALGVRLAVDDFGTGYASLGRLRAFPFDALKLDQSFLRGVVAIDQEVPLVRAVTQLARALDMSVVAEGVETPAQLAVALRYGCAEAQGFLFSRPLPADDLAQLLDDPTWDTDPGTAG